MKVSLMATTAMGLEAVLAREIKAAGIDPVRIFDGRVEFDGTLEDIINSNLWLRTAGRIYIKIGEFTATTFDDLFEKTKALPWSDWIQKDGNFPVANVTSRKSTLFSKSDCQAIVKKAVVESLRSAFNTQTLPETGADFPIRIQIDSDVVTLSIDSSGTGLNKRGYRSYGDAAPLRETLAAGLILLSRWRPNEDVLLDPFCGTGTILIEAGLLAKNIAPGLNRSFNSEKWQVMGKQRWVDAKAHAQSLIKLDAPCQIYGSDINGKTLSAARVNIDRAGLIDIHVQKLPVSEISSRFAKGRIIANPPYGERLSDRPQVEALYREMGAVFRMQFPEWSYYVLTANDHFESLFGQKSDKNRKLYNGGIKCWFYQFFSSKNVGI